MKSKKIISKAASALVLSSILLAGCSSSGEKTSESADKVTVDVFQYKVEFRQQFEDLVNKYEKEHPDVDINVTTVGGGNDYMSSLKASFGSGDAPDIYNFGGVTDIQEYKPYLADLSDTAAANAAVEGTLDGVTENESVLGLPLNQEGYGLIYNKSIFEKAGINAEDIKTQDDLEKAVKKLDSQKDELGIEAVFALPASEKWVVGIHLSNVFLAPEFNNDVMKAFEAEAVTFEKGKEEE